ncbi:MAG: DUF5684 domain-containing protein [Phycisphaerales bacterium JB065]
MMDIFQTVAQSSGNGGPLVAVFALFWVVFCLGFIIFMIAGMWKTFTKAGQPGWGVLIPIYNNYLMCKIAGRPGWWVLLLFIPIVNVVIMFILSVDIASAFGKSVGFALGLFFLTPIFYLILGFGAAQYQGPSV